MNLLSLEALYALRELQDSYSHIRIGRHASPMYGYFCAVGDALRSREKWDDVAHGWTPDEAILSYYLYRASEWETRGHEFYSATRPARAASLQLPDAVLLQLAATHTNRDRERVIQLQ